MGTEFFRPRARCRHRRLPGIERLSGWARWDCAASRGL